MYGNLAAGYLEGNDLRRALDGDGDLAAGRALDEAHNAVLREFDSGDGAFVHLEETVPCPEAHLLRRTAGNHFKHYRSILRHVELYADTVEIAREVFLRFGQFHRRQID